jgi:hypothetical protein
MHSLVAGFPGVRSNYAAKMELEYSEGFTIKHVCKNIYRFLVLSILNPKNVKIF